MTPKQPYNALTDADLLSLVVGVFLPPFVSIIQQKRWPDWFRALVAALVCILVGVLTASTQGLLWEQVASGQILRPILLVLICAITTYGNFWKKTGATEAIEKLTAVPSFGEIVAEQKRKAAERDFEEAEERTAERSTEITLAERDASEERIAARVAAILQEQRGEGG